MGRDSKEKAHELKTLVAELLKAQPSLPALKQLSEKVGREFKEDTTELMSMVLQEMNQTLTGFVNKKRKSHETSV